MREPEAEDGQQGPAYRTGIVYLVSLTMHRAMQAPADYPAEADGYCAMLPEVSIVETFSPRRGEVDGPVVAILKLR